jgi:hypothetical protein
MDLPPEIRYKKDHVLPGGFIPGPNKPKNLDSFIFPGLHHLSALQREGLNIWDAWTKITSKSFPFLALATADAPGMACINGFVGHQGKLHCRLYCPIVGRHRPEQPAHYSPLQKPINYSVAGCDHDDVDLCKLLYNFKFADTSK